MTSAPSTTTKSTTVNNKTGVTTSTSTVKKGNSTTVSSTTTIGKAAPVAKKSSTSSVAKPATLPGAVLGSEWTAGPNTDGWGLCAPVALANALLGATGVEAPNAEIERLYARAGGSGDTGVPVVSALAAAHRYGLAGCRLKAYRRAALDDADILLLQMPEGLHSAAFAAMTVITWGGEIPLEEFGGTILGAWSLTWHGTETA